MVIWGLEALLCGCWVNWVMPYQLTMVLFTLIPQSPNNVYNFCKFGPFAYPSYRNDLINDMNKSVRPIFNISKIDEVIKFCPVQIWRTGATYLLR
jgi:hypothetical protein